VRSRFSLTADDGRRRPTTDDDRRRPMRSDRQPGATDKAEGWRSSDRERIPEGDPQALR
jgi:hypothetical protein